MSMAVTDILSINVGDLVVYTRSRLGSKAIFRVLSVVTGLYDSKDHIVLNSTYGNISTWAEAEADNLRDKESTWAVPTINGRGDLPVTLVDAISMSTLENLCSERSFRDFKIYSNRNKDASVLYAKDYQVDYSIGTKNVSGINQINPKGNKMNNIITKVSNKNVEAAKAAATIVSGNTLNKTIMKKIRPHLPMLLKGYSEHVLAEVVVANLVSVAIDNYAPNNSKAVWAANAMMTSAMTNLLSSFNIEDVISELLDGITIPDSAKEAL